MSGTNSANNVSAGKPKVGGAVFTAPVSTSLPTSADASLNQAFVNDGYISSDGVTRTFTPQTGDDVKAWGGDVVLSTQTGKTDQYKLKFIESMNKDVLKLINGENNVTGELATGLKVVGNSEEAQPHAYVIDQVLKGNILYRIVLPNATISEIDDIVYKDDEPIGYGCTLKALPDSSGNTHYDYYKQGPSGATGATA